MSERKRILILGAGGKDFHVFNTCYRNDPTVEVVAITATQIPHIDKRTYPPVLAGELYPEGIPIVPEETAEDVIREKNVEEAVFAYSDVSYAYVEEMKKRIEATGAKFATFDVDKTMIESAKPVVAVVAVRTGCGKSQVSRRVAEVLRGMGKRVVAIRHPMPYGNLGDQVAQRFACIEDLEKHKCTIEEMEEYEPHITAGNIIYAGADYEKILRQAEEEADVIIWDGGNNDTPFYKPDVYITVVDPLRAGHELDYFPSRDNFERANVVVFNKMGQAKAEDVALIKSNLEKHNPDAVIVEANSPVTVADEDAVRGKRVLVVEDGPTVTHGGMGYGAGFIAANRLGAEIVDPRPFLDGEIAAAFEKYSHLEHVLPALGYGDGQVAELQATINRVDCDVVLIGTPIDLSRIVKIDRPHVRVTYKLDEITRPGLQEILTEKVG
jgi:predicted GTPase